MRGYGIEDLVKFATDAEHKAALLEMMDTFAAFCEKHGLRYFLSGGTLLGAIRHKGFIPWDDDVDVNMPRPDCDKLWEISGGRIGKYILNPPNYSTLYHAYHYKLYNEDILVGKMGDEALRSKTTPIFIDIFPIDGLPDTVKATAQYYKELQELKDCANRVWISGWSRFRYGGRNPIKKHKAKAKIYECEKIGRKELFERVVRKQLSIPFDTAKYIGVTSTNVHQEEERVPKDAYMTPTKVIFEGHTFNAPSNYDVYLKQLYGEHYMNILPVYKQVSRHGLIPFHSKVHYFPDRKEFDWEAWRKSWMSVNRNIKVAICGLIRSENIGEQFIAKSLEFLIGSLARDKNPMVGIDFREVDLLGRKDEIENYGTIQEKKYQNYPGFYRKGQDLDNLFQKLKKKADNSNSQFKVNMIQTVRNIIWTHGANYKKRLEKFFAERLEGVDFIVVDGAGLLEYSYNEYQWSLLLISKYAEAHHIPVVYNAIGRAGDFNEKDVRSKTLKRALQSDMVKYVSARDSRAVVQTCAGSKHNVKLLADAAFWMKETYGFEAAKYRRKIGIGIVRGSALTGYGDDFTSSDWVQLFTDIAQELEARGYEYEFFTNGLPSDISVGLSVLERLALPTTKLVTRPHGDLELYGTISEYQALITCRMHSSIAAFTLGIPSVILSWNDKVEGLMNTIGYPERAITKMNFRAAYIVDAMELAIAEGVDENKLNNMKNMALESVTDYIDMILAKK